MLFQHMGPRYQPEHSDTSQMTELEHVKNLQNRLDLVRRFEVAVVRVVFLLRRPRLYLVVQH